MRIVVIGERASLAQSCARLDEHGHDAIAAAPSTGVNTFTAKDCPSLAGTSVVATCRTRRHSTTQRWGSSARRPQICSRGRCRGWPHVALSVVGTDRLPAERVLPGQARSGEAISEGPIPYSIVHATQFFESSKLSPIATVGDTVRMPPRIFSRWPLRRREDRHRRGRYPVKRHREIGGPEAFLLPDLIRTALTPRRYPRGRCRSRRALLGGRTRRTHPRPGDGATLFDTRSRTGFSKRPRRRSRPLRHQANS